MLVQLIYKYGGSMLCSLCKLHLLVEKINIQITHTEN